MENGNIAEGTLGGEGAKIDDELAALSGQAEKPAEPTPDPEPEAKKNRSPARQYIVLKVDKFDDGEEYTTQVGTVESRNAQNALRKAARELRDKLGGDEATLLVVPQTMWRPTPIRLSVTENVSVSIG